MCQARNGHIGLWISIQPKDDISAVFGEHDVFLTKSAHCPEEPSKASDFVTDEDIGGLHILYPACRTLLQWHRGFTIYWVPSQYLYIWQYQNIWQYQTTYSFSLAISNNIFNNLRGSLMFSQNHITASFNSTYTMDKKSYFSISKLSNHRGSPFCDNPTVIPYDRCFELFLFSLMFRYCDLIYQNSAQM